MSKPMPPDFYQQLEEIQAIDFVMDELVLYLDTHPTDQNALQQYNHFAQYSKQIKQKFESTYGPLQKGSPNANQNYWTWSESPWPWQV